MNKQKFAKVILDKSPETFVVYFVALTISELAGKMLHLSRNVQVSQKV